MDKKIIQQLALDNPQIEYWLPILDYEGMYEVSSFGQVKSLARVVERNDGAIMTLKERILKPGLSGRKSAQYYSVKLCKECASRTMHIHTLVTMAFKDYIPNNTLEIVIDHFDENKLNNIVSNLHLTNNRNNCSKSINKNKTSSKKIGVSWNKRDKKYNSQIYINNKIIHIGNFTDEKRASDAYQIALKYLDKFKTALQFRELIHNALGTN